MYGLSEIRFMTKKGKSALIFILMWNTSVHRTNVFFSFHVSSVSMVHDRVFVSLKALSHCSINNCVFSQYKKAPQFNIKRVKSLAAYCHQLVHSAHHHYSAALFTKGTPQTRHSCHVSGFIRSSSLAKCRPCALAGVFSSRE